MAIFNTPVSFNAIWAENSSFIENNKMGLRKLMFHQWIMVALTFLGVSVTVQTVAAAPSCSQIYTNQETVDFEADVFLDGKRIAGSLTEAYKHPDVIKLFADGRKFREDFETNKSRFILEAHLPKSEGGGVLRLVTLDLSRRGYIYNHPELIALLKVNPRLANSLGMYRVPVSSSVAWIPDAATLNVRMLRFARENGFNKSLFYFETVDGLVSQEQFVAQIAHGLWPSSGPSRPDMTTHDSIHSIAFAAMNARASTRKILATIRSRAQASLTISQKLRAEFGEKLQKMFLDQHVTGIVTGPTERSMLLVILMSGHYDYQSVHTSWRNGTLAKQKINREITQKRLQELMAHYSFGTVSFKEAIGELSKDLSPQQSARLEEIFSEARKSILIPTDKELSQAADALMDFFSAELFSDAVPADGPTLPSRFYRPTVAAEVENQN